MFAPKELLRKVPKAWIGVAGMDILRDEGIEYGKKLQEEGVEIEIQVYEGGPHPIMAMDGKHQPVYHNLTRILIGVLHFSLIFFLNFRVSKPIPSHRLPIEFISLAP